MTRLRGLNLKAEPWYTMQLMITLAIGFKMSSGIIFCMLSSFMKAKQALLIILSHYHIKKMFLS